MKQQLRRGFKSEADAYAREYRKELSLRSHDPLCPWRLAQHLEIPVDPLSAYTEIQEAVAHFMEQDRESFSAVTIIDGYRRRIIHNDSHPPHRQASNIAHELGHGILGHIPRPVLDEHGCRHFDVEQEDEANWLGPALLISKEAAFHIAKTKMSVVKASRVYQVSKQVITMRLNVSGARKIVARLKMKH
jgi:Zn-dependent peptidase ImmA (M78 family)